MEQDPQNSLFEAPGKPAVKIFGVGNAGIALLGALAIPEFAGAQLAAVNTDGQSLAATTAATVKIHLENKLLRGLGSGGDPDRSRALAEEQFSTLKSACPSTLEFGLEGRRVRNSGHSSQCEGAF